MTEFLTVAQMRAITQAAIESGDITGLELMERAGRSVVDAIFSQWPALTKPRGPVRDPGFRQPVRYEGDKARLPGCDETADPSRWRAFVFCGPGNNGGDGFVIARLLHAQNWNVNVFFCGQVDKLPPDARANYDRWVKLGDVIFTEDYTPEWDTGMRTIDDHGYDPVLIIDAVFGIGLNRPVSDAMGEWYFGVVSGRMAGSEGFGYAGLIVAVDIPSGLSADKGHILLTPHGQYMEAHMTVTFHAKKRAHVVGAHSTICGKVVVKDIGL